MLEFIQQWLGTGKTYNLLILRDADPLNSIDMAVSAQQLFKAVQHNDQVAVKRALNLNPALVHAKHARDARTPLHVAAASGNKQLLRELLHLGASCQSFDCNNETPLHVATRQGHADIVKELVKDAGRRSCLKELNRDGSTPLHIAVAAGHTGVVQLLLNAGARGDLKDRAGRTPHDLVEADNMELAEVLIAGRQLTPGSAGRTRRMISPGVSPTSFQHFYSTCSQQQHKPDMQDLADAFGSATKADHGSGSPSRRKDVAGSRPQSVVKQQQQQLSSSQVMSDHEGLGDQVRASVDAHEQQSESNSQQSWLQFSPQRPRPSGSSQQDELQASIHRHIAPYLAGGANAQVAPQADTLQHQHSFASVHVTPSSAGPSTAVYHVITGSATCAPGGLRLHNHQQQVDQQRQQQQQQQQQQSSPRFTQHPGQMGPLCSARTMGPMAASLARSFGHTSAEVLPAGMVQLGTSSLRGQPASVISAAGLCGGVSHIVSPESSSGLLNSGVSTAQYSSKTHPAAVAAIQQQSSNVQQLRTCDSFNSTAAPASVTSCSRHLLNHVPAGDLEDQYTPQQHQFSALAAAVSANARVGPLQLPVQSQLSELTKKVHQLEKWFEAQVGLIPEWQKVLAVVQGVKRQAEEHQTKLMELDATSCSQHGSLEHLAVQVAKLQGAQAHLGNHITHLADEQESMKTTLTAFGQQTSQLESQVVHQASVSVTRIAHESQMASVRDDMSAAAGRLSAIETAMHTMEAGLLAIQHQSAAAVKLEENDAAYQHASRPGAEEAAMSSARLTALEAGLAEVKLILLGLQQAQSAAAAADKDPTAVQGSFLPFTTQLLAEQSVTAASAPSCSTAQLQTEVDELKQRIADLSLSVCGVGSSSSPLQGGTVEEAILPFMETTSNCLQQHEQQLDDIQAILPRLESVLEQRALVCELAQQLTALQTAFSLLTGGKDLLNSRRPASGVLPAGPLSSQKSAADYMAMATSMAKLQNQMAALSAAVGQLQLEWETAAAAMKMENQSIRSTWDSERARMSACEREAVRRLADQHKELQAREDKLLQIREAALAEEAARYSQFESESRVAAALQNMHEGQHLIGTRVAGLADATEALQQQVDSLQADLENSLARLAPQTAQMAAHEGATMEAEPTADVPASTSAATAATFHCPSNSMEVRNPDTLQDKTAAKQRAQGILSLTSALAQQQVTNPMLLIDEVSTTLQMAAAAPHDKPNPFLFGSSSLSGCCPVEEGTRMLVATAVAAAAAAEAEAIVTGSPDVPKSVDEAGSVHSRYLHHEQHISGLEAAEDTVQVAVAVPALYAAGRTGHRSMVSHAACASSCNTPDTQYATAEPTVIPPCDCDATAAAAAPAPAAIRHKVFRWFGKANETRNKGGNHKSCISTQPARARSANPLADNPEAHSPHNSACGPDAVVSAANKESKWSKGWQKARLGRRASKDYIQAGTTPCQ